MAGDGGGTARTWQSCQQDLSDQEWELIADLVPTYSGGGRMGRPATHAKRDIVNAILYVAATGCQWRALPRCYPNWNTVYRYHLAWSRDGTWEAIVDRLRALVREREGREPEPSAGIVDARSTQGASTVCCSTRGYDAGKKISGRKTFGVVDTLGLLLWCLGGRGQLLGQHRWYRCCRACQLQDLPARQGVVRRRVQDHL